MTPMGKKLKSKKAKAKKPKVNKAAAADRVKKILPILKKTYPNARTALDFAEPLELLIATILSAQCTDVRVNMVTKDLFKKYRSVKDWADADIEQIEDGIRSTGFYHNKRFGGKVPHTLEQLVQLPGVGRKTANCVLGGAFGKPGITCDTHVIRLSRRIGLSANRDPVKLEIDLMEIVPQKSWTLFSNLLISLGRSVCKARKPDCQNCPVSKYCPAANKPALW
jgi:endonuclease-3